MSLSELIKKNLKSCSGTWRRYVIGLVYPLLQGPTRTDQSSFAHRTGARGLIGEFFLGRDRQLVYCSFFTRHWTPIAPFQPLAVRFGLFMVDPLEYGFQISSLG